MTTIKGQKLGGDSMRLEATYGVNPFLIAVAVSPIDVVVMDTHEP
jgi:hypothetical protein